jgi:hypothetical protein
MVEQSELRVLTLRRSEKVDWKGDGPWGSCPLPPRWPESKYRAHDATVEIGRWRSPELPSYMAGWERVDLSHGYGWSNCGPATNPANARLPWPTTCGCGYVFTANDERSLDVAAWWRSVDNPSDERRWGRDFGAGAMYWAPWCDRIYRPQLAHCLVAVCPGGSEWVIDSQANNCTMPEDRMQEHHHCWSLDGVPPVVTAGKRGPTCSAGAGSIVAGDYHGFLQEGFFTPG